MLTLRRIQNRGKAKLKLLLNLGKNTKKNAAGSSITATLNKFRQISKTLIEQKFHISQFDIFKVVDESFDKFCGFALNIDMAILLKQQEYKAT